MNKAQKRLIAFGIAVFIIHIAGNIFLGGYTPVIKGDLAVPLWLFVIAAQLAGWLMSGVMAILALSHNDRKSLAIAIAVLILVTIPIFLPLPGLFVK